jgi:hypothetical protein
MGKVKDNKRFKAGKEVPIKDASAIPVISGSNNIAVSKIQVQGGVIPVIKVPSCASPSENTDILRNVLMFVGKNRYRFIASVNRHFRDTYLELFPDNKETSYYLPTIGQAQICFDERNNVDTSWYDDEYDYTLNNDHLICWSAARYGHLHILQYLRSIGCAWNAMTTQYAASEGNLPMLQWARANGCPWDYRLSTFAKPHTMKWAKENGWTVTAGLI